MAIIVEYTYPDDTRGSARAFAHGASLIPASYLAQRADESDAAWSDRLAAVGIKAIYRITASTADPNLYDTGDPVEAVTDGVTAVTYPDPVAKVPVWSTSTREVMYISTGADVPTGYTDQEPPHAVYAVWDDGAWAVDLDSAYAAKQAEIVTGSDAVLTPYAVKYGTFEQVSWAKQLKEAEAYTDAPTTAVTPWLDATTETTEEKAELAAEIMANDTAWSALSGAVARQRRDFQLALDTAKALSGDAAALAAIEDIEVAYVVQT